jgi:LPXTG-motif cell wall-anchored protein
MQDFLASTDKPYLLDPTVESEGPLTIYKSFWQILLENYAWISILALAIILVGIAFYFIRKRKKSSQDGTIEESVDPYQEALLAIEELQGRKLKLEPKPFVFRLSEILRIYIQKRFQMPAMELTGEEFIVEIASNPFFSRNYEDLLRDFVDQGDRVKYSKEATDTSQINLLLDSALFFVKDTNKRIEDQEQAKDDGENLVPIKN